jgi:hypothetical protein
MLRQPGAPLRPIKQLSQDDGVDAQPIRLAVEALA